MGDNSTEFLRNASRGGSETPCWCAAGHTRLPQVAVESTLSFGHFAGNTQKLDENKHSLYDGCVVEKPELIGESLASSCATIVRPSKLVKFREHGADCRR